MMIFFMKKIKSFAFGFSILFAFMTFQSCSFFYGESAELSYTAMFDSLWREYDETYALFDVRGVDWQNQYSICRPLINDNMTDKEFLDVLKRLLYPLNDAHVYVKASIGCLNSGEDNVVPDNFSLAQVCQDYVESPVKCGNQIITYGRLRNDSQTGYIHIAAFSSGQTGINQKQNWADDIDLALESLRDTNAIILDVRGNRGGLTGNVTRISGRFCSENKIYAISRTKNGCGRNDFGNAVSLEIKKNGSWQYTKPVILLTNAQTMSAGEEFTMALVSQPHVIQVGNHTCGVFSLSLERCLANGWKYSVSVQKVTDTEGNIPEGKGIVPAAENLILNTSASDDLQMERAIQLCD